MARRLTPGKRKSLEAVSDKNGIIAAAAMDQRGSLQKSIAKAKGIDPKDLPREDMENFKIEVVKALTPHASAILLDPEFGLPASKVRAPGAGLLLAYEVTGYDNAVPGRLPELLPNYSVRQLKADGGDCVKILLYYHPDEGRDINETKKEFIRKVGRECSEEDIAFFMEPVGYDLKGGDGKDLEYARMKPRIVKETMKEFTKDEYGIDVLKVEIPVNLKYAEGARSYKGQKAYTLEEAKEHYRAAAAESTIPFIYLSAGVSNDEFQENLEIANESGTPYNGILCGRATWADGIAVYGQGGPKALAAWLQDKGLKNLNAINTVLRKGAKSWQPVYA